MGLLDRIKKPEPDTQASVDTGDYTQTELAAATEELNSDSTQGKMLALDADWEKYVKQLRNNCENRILDTSDPKIFEFSSSTEKGFSRKIGDCEISVIPIGDFKFRLQAVLDKSKTTKTYSINFGGNRIIINSDFHHMLLPFEEKSTCGMSMYYFSLTEASDEEVFGKMIQPIMDVSIRELEYQNGIGLKDLQYYQKFNPNDGSAQLIIRLHKDKPEVIESKFELTRLLWWNQGDEYSFLVEQKKNYHLIRGSKESIEIPSGLGLKGFNIQRIE